MFASILIAVRWVGSSVFFSFFFFSSRRRHTRLVSDWSSDVCSSDLYGRSLDLRYRGQGYELNVPATANVAARFHDEHQRRYGYHHAGREIELVTLRLRVRLRTPPLEVARRRAARKASGRVAAVERAPVFFQ